MSLVSSGAACGASSSPEEKGAPQQQGGLFTRAPLPGYFRLTTKGAT